MNSRTIFALAAAASLAIVGPAPASTQRGSYTVKVPYGDLDLTTPVGAKALKARLAAAAGKSCRQVNDSPSTQYACREKALALAAPRADAVVYAARFERLTAQG